MLETVTGRFVDLIDPNPQDIHIEDISWSLSRLSRFNGHTIQALPYTVGQHSIVVADEVGKLIDKLGTARTAQERSRLMLLGLLHDASEAYTGDVSGPLKKIPELRPVIKKIEHKIQSAIYASLNVDPPTEDEEHTVIKPCDILSQRIEAYNFMVSRGRNWSGDLPEVSIIRLQAFEPPLESVEVHQRFLNYYHQLKSQLSD
jgi:hypothetical protein